MDKLFCIESSQLTAYSIHYNEVCVENVMKKKKTKFPNEVSIYSLNSIAIYILINSGWMNHVG